MNVLPPHLATVGLTRTFGGSNGVTDVNLAIPEGALFGLLGPNGAGKSTTLRLLTGLLRPERGEIRRQGRPIRPHRKNARTGLGALIEEPGLWTSLTGRQHIDAIARLVGGPVDRDWTEMLVERLAIGPALHRRVGGWSFGMRQRLGILLAMVTRPSLLVLDEPTNGLDPRGIRAVRDLLREQAREHGVTVIVSSHLLLEMEELCTDVAIIDRGRVRLQGNLQELLGSRRALRMHPLPHAEGVRTLTDDLVGEHHVRNMGDHVLVDVNEDPESEARDLVQALAARGIRVGRVETAATRLEDLFLEVTEEPRQ